MNVQPCVKGKGAVNWNKHRNLTEDLRGPAGQVESERQAYTLCIPSEKFKFSRGRGQDKSAGFPSGTTGVVAGCGNFL